MKILFKITLLALALSPMVQASVYFSTVGWTGFTEGDLDQSVSWDVTTHIRTNNIQIEDGKAVWGDDTKITFFHDMGTVLGAGESLYYAMRITVTGGNGVHSFAAFRESGSLNLYSAHASIDLTGDADFHFGISNSEAAEDGFDGMQYGQEYTMVVGYEFDTGLSSLWIDPTSAASSKVTTGGAGSAAGKNLDEFVFLSGSGDGSVHSVSALAIADTFSEAYGAVAVPEPSAYGLLFGLVSLLAISSTRYRVRRG